jgi:electron transport complex protein RnfB
MGNQTEVYKKIAARYGVPGSEPFIKVLNAMITPEEGEILLELQHPITLPELARKVAIDETRLRKKLDDVAKRGVIRPVKDGYTLPPHIMLMCHWTQNKSDEVDKLWTEFFFKEWRYEIAKRSNERRLTGMWSTHRIVPALQALAASPHIPPEQILWYENYEVMFRRSKMTLFLPCSCRTQHRQCDNKMDLCVHVMLDDANDESEFTGILQRWPHLKPLTYQEAMNEMYAAEDAGLGHLSLNFPRLEEACNWCECCCRVVNPLIHAGLDYDLMDPSKSRFQASTNQELCNGCQTCMERCIFGAIEMVKVAGSKKMKARIIEKKCMGCGLCVYTCPEKAIRFDIVRPPEHIPDITREQVFSWGPPPSPEDIRKAYKPRAN